MSEPTPPEQNSHFPSMITLPVQWGDQDAFGHVNNTVYLRWFESSRIAYMDAVGLGAMMETDGIGPILVSIGCEYRQQLSFPDTVHVGAKVTRIGRTSLDIEHEVRSESLGVIVAEGQSTVVVFDYKNQQPVPVPAVVRAAIAAVEGRNF